jgi:hypothetical protein
MLLKLSAVAVKTAIAESGIPILSTIGNRSIQRSGFLSTTHLSTANLLMSRTPIKLQLGFDQIGSSHRDSRVPQISSANERQALRERFGSVEQPQLFQHLNLTAQLGDAVLAVRRDAETEHNRQQQQAAAHCSVEARRVWARGGRLGRLGSLGCMREASHHDYQGSTLKLGTELRNSGLAANPAQQHLFSRMASLDKFKRESHEERLKVFKATENIN